ncbi:MAG: aminotransferase class I/II-fold pyridoxal phosphate-dependent enzyme, partial [Alphaproteobacteria bacterium]|nr:aminotransferase class I/II-fold pyridoxal phosphate-dependent enzyme [Alphaproteobacteria bacterium]
MSDTAGAAAPLEPVRAVLDIEQRIAGVLAPVQSGHPLHAPEIDGHAWAYVKDCLDSGWVSSVGAWVDRFEDMLAETTGARHAIATVNGTAALHATLLACGVRPGDEVLLPSFTFVATANAVSYCGATPHFVDCESESFGIDPVRLAKYLENSLEMRDGEPVNRQTGASVRALLPVHIYGHPADMNALLDIAQAYDLTVIEDAAESLGSYIGDRHTGRFGRAGVLSFNGNKTITTGGGGAVVTSDEALAKRLKHLTTTAKLPHRWAFDHDEIGYNY